MRLDQRLDRHRNEKAGSRREYRLISATQAVSAKHTVFQADLVGKNRI
jgi:hypothetical protein